MSLLGAFNDSFLKSLLVVQRSFADRPSWTEKVQYVERALLVDPKTAEFFHEFDKDCKPLMGDINQCNSAIMTDNSIGYLRKLDFSSIWAAMDDSEKTVFWSHLKALCQCCCMVNACGESLGDLEQIATAYVERNRGKSFQECQSGLIQDMLSGGDMSTAIFKTLQNPSTVTNLISNVADLFEGMPGLTPDITDMIKDVRSMDSDQFKQDIAEMLSSSGDDLKQAQEVLSATLGNFQSGQNAFDLLSSLSVTGTGLKSFDMSSMLSSLQQSLYETKEKEEEIPISVEDPEMSPSLETG